MKNNFVCGLLLLLVVNVTSLTVVPEVSLSQEKCELYRGMFRKPATKKFPFMVRVYNGYYLNGKLITENDADFSNGVIISENFVLSVANNGTGKLLYVKIADDVPYEVIQKDMNEQQTIMLLKLSKSVKFYDHIRPACLPQSPINSFKKTFWVDDSWLSHLELKLAPRGGCEKNSGYYTKRLRIIDVHNGRNLCTLVVNDVHGDRDKRNMPGSILLNGNQEVVGVATELLESGLQIFVQVSDYVLWIENIIWATSNVSSTIITTDVTSESPRESTSTTTTIVFNSTTANTPKSNETSEVRATAMELHDVHLFLNVILVLTVVIFFLVLCISSILWSDGQCIRAALSKQFSTSTDV